ncbi:MAG TPA: hypothetical protein VNW15_06920 [Rhizomicrobium sp.]|jgi:hypothetical protein|nr:hypothetical protein [Rhizomicrobium sp.]
MKESFWFGLGPYQIRLPGHAHVAADVIMPSQEGFGRGFTRWTFGLNRFQIFIHLSGEDLSKLKEFIDYTTKSDVIVRQIQINGIAGVMYGNYGPPRTWIDWWFKNGNTTICLCLQSTSFPFTQPTQAEIDEHDVIIGSITVLEALNP